MDAVLTVKQPYADRIMEGTKRYEFRRKAPARDIDGLYVHIAGTGPYAQAYVGVNCVHTGTPEAIWEYCSECAAIMPPGISREDFFAYFDGCETATAISLAPRPQVLNPPILLEYLGLKGAPQSIAYAKPQQPEIGDYICPYCGHEQQSTYDEWEGSDFEDRTTVWCRRCGQSFDVYREWVAYYTNVEPDPCSMCPGSESTERFRDGWRCRIGGCATMKED